MIKRCCLFDIVWCSDTSFLSNACVFSPALNDFTFKPQLPNESLWTWLKCRERDTLSISHATRYRFSFGRVGNGARLQHCRWLTLHQYGTDPFRTDNCWQIECWIKVFLTAQNPIKGVGLPPIRIHKSLWCLLESFYARVSFSTIRSLLNSDCHRRQCSTCAHYKLCDNSKAFVREQTCHFSTKCIFTSYCVHILLLLVFCPCARRNLCGNSRLNLRVCAFNFQC